MLKELTDKSRHDLTCEIEFFQKSKAPLFLPHIICADNTMISVQACRIAYCYPTSDEGPYTHVEVGFLESPHVVEDLLTKWGWSEFQYDEYLFGYVPIELVIQCINIHGGIKRFGDIPKINKWRD